MSTILIFPCVGMHSQEEDSKMKGKVERILDVILYF